MTDRTSSVSPSAEHLAAETGRACIDAAQLVAFFAARFLTSPSARRTDDCIEWCILTTRVLGACADVLREHPAPHREAVLALARAGSIAAGGCATAMSEFTDAASARNAREACQHAAATLAEYVAHHEGAVESPALATAS